MNQNFNACLGRGGQFEDHRHIDDVVTYASRLRLGKVSCHYSAGLLPGFWRTAWEILTVMWLLHAALVIFSKPHDL